MRSWTGPVTGKSGTVNQHISVSQMFKQNPANICDVKEVLYIKTHSGGFSRLKSICSVVTVLWSVRHCLRLQHFLFFRGQLNYGPKKTAAIKTDLRLISSRNRVLERHGFLRLLFDSPFCCFSFVNTCEMGASTENPRPQSESETF